MKKSMKLFIEKFYKDNGGMSIVTVIVAIGMVLLMVNIILLTSTVNYKMRNMNVYSKDSFYSAEQVLDEIEVGLQQMVSDGLSQAYMEVLTKYDTSEMTSAEKNEMVRNRFYTYINGQLAITNSSGEAIEFKDEAGRSYFKYIAMPDKGYMKESRDLAKDEGIKEGLYALLKDSTRYHNQDDPDEVDKSYGAFLRTSDNEFYTAEDGKIYNTGKYYESAKDGLHLKNLVIYYKDPNGFVSTIRTDINLVYPEFTFANTDMPDIASYCLITDGGITYDKTGVDKSYADRLTLNGNSFAYAVDTTGLIHDFPDYKGSENIHVVYDGFNVSNGAIKTYDKTQLWAGDIVAKSSDVTLAGRTYVQDDLNLKGRNCIVKMSGYYYGFGNSLDSAQGSSAILVNGVDTVIDLENIKKLSLAGRASISFEDDLDKNGNPTGKIMKDPVHQATINPNPLNVYMGESIAAKSDQLMYLVPPECIGVRTSGTGEEDDPVNYYGSMFNKNPLTVSEYQQVIDEPNCVMIASNMNVSKLGSGDNAKLGYYLKNGTEVQKVVINSATGGDSLVYFYMTFADEDKANLFFQKYYDLNKEAVDEYMSKYIKTINLPTTGSLMLKVNVAGHIVADNLPEAEIDVNTGKKKRMVSGVTTKLKDEDVSIMDHYEEDFEAYSTMLMGYGTKLSDDYQRLIDNGEMSRGKDELGKDNMALFKNLIDEESLSEIVGGSGFAYFTDGKKHKALLICKKNIETEYPLSADDVKNCNLIIADCALSVPAGTDFKGTVIAKGKIKLGGSAQFTVDSKLVDECMFLTTDDNTYTVADAFKDSSELTNLSAMDGDIDTDIDIEDLVKFENWTRNVPIN